MRTRVCTQGADCNLKPRRLNSQPAISQRPGAPTLWDVHTLLPANLHCTHQCTPGRITCTGSGPRGWWGTRAPVKAATRHGHSATTAGQPHPHSARRTAACTPQTRLDTCTAAWPRPDPNSYATPGARPKPHARGRARATAGVRARAPIRTRSRAPGRAGPWAAGRAWARASIRTRARSKRCCRAIATHRRSLGHAVCEAPSDGPATGFGASGASCDERRAAAAGRAVWTAWAGDAPCKARQAVSGKFGWRLIVSGAKSRAPAQGQERMQQQDHT